MAFTREKLTERLSDVSDRDADKIIGLIRGSLSPETVPSTAAWVAQCFHAPRKSEQIMHAIDATMDGYGVETVLGREHDRFYGSIVAEYVNVGDSYATTIIFDCVAQRYKLMDVGTFVEQFEQQYGIV